MDGRSQLVGLPVSLGLGLRGLPIGVVLQLIRLGFRLIPKLAPLLGSLVRPALQSLRPWKRIPSNKTAQQKAALCLSITPNPSGA